MSSETDYCQEDLLQMKRREMYDGKIRSAIEEKYGEILNEEARKLHFSMKTFIDNIKIKSGVNGRGQIRCIDDSTGVRRYFTIFFQWEYPPGYSLNKKDGREIEFTEISLGHTNYFPLQKNLAPSILAKKFEIKYILMGRTSWLASAICRSKVEKTILDVLAHNFERERAREIGMRIERERSKTYPEPYSDSPSDLVFITDNTDKEIVVGVIEAKYYFCFDILTGNLKSGKEKEAIEYDIKKLQSLGNSVYKKQIIFFAHYGDVVPAFFKYSEKHNKEIQKYLTKGKSAEDMLDDAKEQLLKFLKQYSPQYEVHLFEIGKYKKIPIFILVASVDL